MRKKTREKVVRGLWRSFRKDLKMETTARHKTGFCSHLQKEKVELTFLLDKKQQHNKNPKEWND